MRDMVDAFAAEYRRYKAMGEGALGQMEEGDLSRTLSGQDNSAIAIVWHVSGNLASRFSDFLRSDGEKPWRDREAEFDKRVVTRAELTARWEEGWKVLLDTLATLSDDELGKTVTIRGQPLSVRDALVRSLAHTSSHIGQLVYLAKTLRGARWRWLTIAPGQSAAYNQNPVRERAPRAVRTDAEEIADRLERTVGGSLWHGPSLRDLREGMTPAEANARPLAAAHSIAELLRHIVVWADFARGHLHEEEVPDLAEAEDWPVGAAVDQAGLAALWSAVDRSYTALAAAVRELTPAELGAEMKRHGRIVSDMVRGVVEHGVYHAGQIALLLRAQRGRPR